MSSEGSSLVDSTLGHYRILKKIGAGGMGEVYRAHDEQLDRDVAIKMLPAASFSDSLARARLIREARSAAALNHPAICTIHEVGEAEGCPYIAMELVEGRRLSDILPEDGLPVDSVLSYGCQISAALAHAHEHLVIHRDLKCGNVIITPDGHVKVLDFGLAKRLSEVVMDQVTTQSTPSLTEQGTVMGTLSYMAPEQLRGDLSDTRSDIWSLGVVLYEMASGIRPFAGRTGFEISSAILNQAPAPLPARIPAGLSAVIERCLRKEPGQRYQHAGEVCAALEAVRTGTATHAFQPSWRTRITPRNVLLLVAVLTVLGAVVAIRTGGWRLRIAGGAHAPKIESLAVLPFENLSGDASQDYLASGIHEALITDLARLSGIHKVIARSSVMRYQKNSPPLSQVAKELNVDAIITGSVLRLGNRMQVTAHLIDGTTQEQLWADRYDREMRDALALVDDIVRSITTNIRLQLLPAEQARLASAPTVDPEAYESYLKARFHQLKQTREDLDLAESYYRDALEKVPDYALAYAGLGMVYLLRSDVGFVAPEEAFPKAMVLIQKAVSLDDSSAEVHASLAGALNAIKWDWAGAEKEYKRAIELNPKYADAHYFYADMLIFTKREAQWKKEMEIARELDPLNDFKESFYGWHLNYLHRYDEAISIFQKMLLTAPNKGSNYLGLWGAYYKKGNYDKAAEAAREYFTTIHERAFADAMQNVKSREEYAAAARRVGDLMVAESAHRHIPAIRVARMYAYAGDNTTAIQWLEKAYQARESPLMRLAVFWDWDPLRSDPRFKDLLRRMNLPE